MSGKRSLLDKWRLVRAAAKDKRLSMGDISVLIALCDRYGSKYDPDAPALAGHALLGAMSGLSRRATIDSTRRLIEAGYVAVAELGSGTRGTRYSLNFARGEDASTTKYENASGEPDFTTVVNQPSPLDPLSGEAHFTESPPTVAPLQEGLHVVEDMFDAAPVAPPAAALKGATAGPASGDGFAEFWKAWPRKHGKKRAEAEWKKIIYDVDTIIEVANDWAAHYAKHGVDKKWIPEPANWLKGERWDEDLPIIHIDAKGAAITKAKANAPAKAEPKQQTAPANDNLPAELPAFMRGSPSLWPEGEYSGEFIENDIEYDYGGKDMAAFMVFQVTSPGAHFGRRLEHRFYIQCFIKSTQEEGQRYLSDICGAVGVSNIEDLDELMFRPLKVRADGRDLTYIQEAA